MKLYAMALAALCVYSLQAGAEIYKHVDDKGRVTYSNVPAKGAKKVDLEPLSTVPFPKPAEVRDSKDAKQKSAGTPSSAPKKAELEAAIEQEERALATARKALEEGMQDPDTFKTTIVGKDGKPQVVTRRNVVAYEEKIKSLQENVNLHEKKLEALKKELAQLP